MEANDDHGRETEKDSDPASKNTHKNIYDNNDRSSGDAGNRKSGSVDVESLRQRAETPRNETYGIETAEDIDSLTERRDYLVKENRRLESSNSLLEKILETATNLLGLLSHYEQLGTAQRSQHTSFHVPSLAGTQQTTIGQDPVAPFPFANPFFPPHDVHGAAQSAMFPLTAALSFSATTTRGTSAVGQTNNPAQSHSNPSLPQQSGQHNIAREAPQAPQPPSPSSTGRPEKRVRFAPPVDAPPEPSLPLPLMEALLRLVQNLPVETAPSHQSTPTEGPTADAAKQEQPEQGPATPPISQHQQEAVRWLGSLLASISTRSGDQQSSEPDASSRKLPPSSDS